MIFTSLVFAAAVTTTPPKTEYHYYPQKVKPEIHTTTKTTQVCKVGKKAIHKEEAVCLSCPEGTTYIDPMCYGCPTGSRIANIQRKAVKPEEQIRCISKQKFEGKDYKEMPPLKLNAPQKKTSGRK